MNATSTTTTSRRERLAEIKASRRTAAGAAKAAFMSKVMKAAWTIFRKGGESFAQALKAAWASAKAETEAPSPWSFKKGDSAYVPNGTYIIATYTPTGVCRIFSSCFGSIESQLKKQTPHTWGTQPELEYAMCGEWRPSKELEKFNNIVKEMQQSMLNAMAAQQIGF